MGVLCYLSLWLTSVTIFNLILPIQAMKRTIGPATDYRFINATKLCNSQGPKDFQFGTCSILIDCVYDNLTEAYKASLSAGTSIAALLPTILSLIGKTTKYFPALVLFQKQKSFPCVNSLKVHLLLKLYSWVWSRPIVPWQLAVLRSVFQVVCSGNCDLCARNSRTSIHESRE